MYNNYQVKEIDKLPYFRFKRILSRFNKIVLETILMRSQGFKMPLGLGFIAIVKYKPKYYNSDSLSKDYKTSKELNKNIYYLNEHSDGYKYRLYWSKTPRTFSDIYKYTLSLTRHNKRDLA
jgi:hypothetical protein